MKIGFLTSNHLPEARGGTEQVTAALEREFGARGVEVVVITSSDVPDSPIEHAVEQHEGVVVHRLYKRLDEWDNTGFVRPRLIGLVRELLERERPDVLHVHSTAALGTGCVAVARELGIPIVWTFHDLWTTCARYFRLPSPGVVCPSAADRLPCAECVDRELRVGRETVARAIAERDRRIAADLALAAVCTAPSHTAARLVRECTPYPGAIEVVPHGILRVPAPGDRVAARLAGEPLRVGTFG
ncbi:MAG: glycosyltransferase, partial [Planctomycetes bacterium]|nr:glycosyltransferase [Planctomycetota bacterium]